MARHVATTLVDDLSGSMDDVRTVSFTYNKIQYDLELGELSRKEFDDLMAPYIKVARKRRGNPSTGGRLARGQGRVIREWAWEKGLLDPSRVTGQLPAALIRQYYEEHK